MVWTAPMTAIAQSIFTASQFNTHIRDNLLETMPARVGVEGQYCVVSGTNSLSLRSVGGHVILTDEMTSSTSYTDLATVGPTVTVETGTSAMVWWNSGVYLDTDNTAAALVGIDISGATTIAANDDVALGIRGISTGTSNYNRFGTSHVFTGLNPGLNTFTMKYRRSGGSGNIGARFRELIVMPF